MSESSRIAAAAADREALRHAAVVRASKAGAIAAPQRVLVTSPAASRAAVAASGPTIVTLAAACFRRDLLADAGSRLALAFHVAHVLLGLASYFFLATTMDPRALRGREPFAFVLVGLAVSAFVSTWLVCFTGAVRGAQRAGTLKLVAASPAWGPALIAASALYPTARAIVDAALYIAGGAIFGLSLRAADPAALVVAATATALAVAPIGIVSAAVTIVARRGEALLGAFMSLAWLLGDVIYPVEALPEGLQGVGRLLPVSHAASALRAALLGGEPVGAALGPIFVFALAGLPASLLLLAGAVRWARASGRLGAPA